MPIFRYQPNAYDLGLFKKISPIKCSVCIAKTDLVYEGPFYTSSADFGDMCAWCVHDGTASQKYSGVFQTAVQHHGKPLSVSYDEETGEYLYIHGDEEITPVLDDELLTILFKTPSYVAWQEPYWLSHCNHYCSFIKYLGKPEAMELSTQLTEDIQKYEDIYGVEFSELLVSAGMYLFQCNSCGKYRLHLDLT
jgi:uncharacterized protein